MVEQSNEFPVSRFCEAIDREWTYCLVLICELVKLFLITTWSDWIDRSVDYCQRLEASEHDSVFFLVWIHKAWWLGSPMLVSFMISGLYRYKGNRSGLTLTLVLIQTPCWWHSDWKLYLRDYDIDKSLVINIVYSPPYTYVIWCTSYPRLVSLYM